MGFRRAGLERSWSRAGLKRGWSRDGLEKWLDEGDINYWAARDELDAAGMEHPRLEKMDWINHQ